MKQMIIHLATSNMFGIEGNAKCIDNFRTGRYLQLPPIPCDMSAENVAEEAFDLTNNPSRQEERIKRYGNGRSVSVGDIIEVEGRFFLCASMGWKEITR
jgi:hypothetical protein